MLTYARERAAAWWRSRTAAAAARALQGRFTGLTIVLVALSFLVSVVRRSELRELLVTIGFSVLVLFAVWSVGRRLRLVTATLALAALIGHWSLNLASSPIPRPVVFALATAFLGYLTLVILFSVLRNAAITADTIVGAVCAYFLLGTTWGCAYALVALASPEAFSVSPALANATEWSRPTLPMTPLLQYYSFVTLCTIGYGDMSTLSAAARWLSVLEGLTGQLYLAILIAHLVGMHTARSPRP